MKILACSTEIDDTGLAYYKVDFVPEFGDPKLEAYYLGDFDKDGEVITKRHVPFVEIIKGLRCAVVYEDTPKLGTLRLVTLINKEDEPALYALFGDVWAEHSVFAIREVAHCHPRKQLKPVWLF